MPSALPDLDSLSDYDDRLRQVPRDVPALARAARLAGGRLRAAKAAGDRTTERRLEGYLGSAYRILGRRRAALRHLAASVALARAADDGSAEVVGLIRLGEAYRCFDATAAAEAHLREAYRLATARPNLQPYVDYALQHLGKCLLDAGRTAEAVECLEAALAIRQTRGDPALIHSTQRALEAASQWPL